MVDLRTCRSAADPRTPGTEVAAATVGRGQSSPRKPTRVLPTPQSLSPSKNSPPEQRGGEPRLPPSFENNHLPPAIASRYQPGVYTPHSPYRPGEYQRSECAPSERTRIERKLFDDDDDMPRKDELRSSSPLQPAFEGEVKMVLRSGAPVDLMSWLRTNFHHQPPPHSVMTSSMSLAHIQRLLQERFHRVPYLSELHRAVLAAFPHSEWEESKDGKEPPIMRGLTWHGRDVADEDDPNATPGKSARASASATVSRGRQPRVDTTVVVNGGATNGAGTSRSPTQSPLMSPVSSAQRQMPDTPARSVLDEFAEIATRTPIVKERKLDTDAKPAAYALTTICNSSDRPWDKRKRPASQSPERGRRRASTPDALQDLLDAAEAVEGSPLNSVLNKHEQRGHKRRRTIAGSNAHDFAFGRPLPHSSLDQRRSRSVRGTASPQIAGLSLLAVREDKSGVLSADEGDEPISPLASEESGASHQLVAMGAPSSWGRRGVASSTASQLSAISESVSLAGPSNGIPKAAGRKVNELPTSSQGQYPGVDCKPPYPYHEMIRFAIENAPDRKLQLAQIYSSIAHRFPFFKTLDEKKTAGWQNSIRHNLSLKKMFVRVNKADGSPDDSGGKGGWWTVQPGVPDEGRPGRKAKAKRAKDGSMVMGGEMGSGSTSATSTPAPPPPMALPPPPPPPPPPTEPLVQLEPVPVPAASQ